MELHVNKTYLSNNPCFPGQLFHVTGFRCSKRFGKDNVLITYERWAFTPGGDFPYRVETTTDWLLTNRDSILGIDLPEDLQIDFNQRREATLFADSLIPA